LILRGFSPLEKTLAGWCEMHSGLPGTSHLSSRCILGKRGGSRTHIWSGLGQSPSNEEPWHFLLAPLCIILVAVPL